MRKIVIYLLLLMSLLLCGCAKEETTEMITEKITEKIIEESDINVTNEYWNENASCINEVKYSEDEGYETKAAEVIISSVAEMESGTIYKIEITQEIPVDRFPVYLYVTEEKIYRLWKSEEEVELIESEKDFIEDSMVVCQKEDLQEVSEDGWHHEITSGEQDNIRESNFYHCNEYDNIVGFWEAFYWKKGQGLIYYRSGYGAEADLVELTCAQETSVMATESESLIGSNDASVVVMEAEFFDMIKANPIDEDMKWEHLGSSDRIYRACQYRDAWLAEIQNSLMTLKKYLTEEDYQSLVESYQGWRKYMENNTALEQQLFYTVTGYTQENTGLTTGDGNTYPYTMEITAERTKHYAIQLKSLEYALTGTIEFVYGTDKSTIDVAENLLLDGKKHFVCDEEKKKNRTYPEETAGKEVYETRDGWEEISIYEEDGNICFEYFIPRETTYEGVVIDCQDGALNVELTDFRDYKMKASFMPVNNHYEFVVTECDEKYFGSLPRTIEFYRTDKTYSEFSSFLKGKEKVIDTEGNKYSITELLEDSEGKYLYCDIDGDGEEELHVRTHRFYYIIKNVEGDLEVIYDGIAYEHPIRQNDLLGILYYRPGGAPNNESYQYHAFDSRGEVQEIITFEWYDPNENGSRDEDDLYLLNGEEVSKQEWEEETRVYREVEIDMEEWSEWKI